MPWGLAMLPAAAKGREKLRLALAGPGFVEGEGERFWLPDGGIGVKEPTVGGREFGSLVGEGGLLA